ncbi:hypothetical protein KDW_46660 [Dictyobacter vulcani]|uniref:Uncharacterized protein n=1 Tax=Dictyobacter vulcani TaxID=2607529 RepID=A0A5J4KMA3_9CHLR|nr:hypothetical protein KDW_46660 [Dictyobacter vulcani]
MLTAHQESALADGEFGVSPDAYKLWFLLLEDIAMTLCAHRLHRRPLLSLMTNILSLIQADRTFPRLLLAGCELGTTGDTNPMLHKYFSFLNVY